MAEARQSGVVYLVGAGPGDPRLLTLRGRECLEVAEVVVYDGLAPAELLDLTPANCLHIYAGKKHSGDQVALTQEQIHAELIRYAQEGKTVVRLKGGDPFVFGRGAEECLALAAEGIRFEIVPGVSSATAVPAYAGLPLTARGLSASAVLVTGHEADGKASGEVDWASVAKQGTIVLFMAWKRLSVCAGKLIAAGLDQSTPAAAIRWGTRSDQEVVHAPLGELDGKLQEAEVRPPVLVIIGQVAERVPALDWRRSLPLAKQCIWLSRDSKRGESFARVLRDQGAQVFCCATTEILHDPQAPVLLWKAIEECEQGLQRCLFLTSKNAVATLASAMHTAGVDSRALAGWSVAAVGPATVKALRDIGLVADVVIDSGGAQALAEKVLQELPDVQHVLYPRATDGREEAVREFEDEGREVSVIDSYRSQVRGSGLAVQRWRSMLEDGRFDLAVFFSPSQVKAALALEPRLRELLQDKKIAVAAIGDTTAKEARSLGLTVRAVAKEPTPEGLAEVLLHSQGENA